MVPFDIPAILVITQSLAVSAKNNLKNEKSLLLNKYFLFTMMFVCFLFLPSSLFFYQGWPDWEWMYFIKASAVNPFGLPLFAIILILCGAGGFIITHYLIKNAKNKIAYILLGLVIVYFLLFNIITIDRAIHIGTYEQYMAGDAISVWGTNLGLALIILLPFNIIIAAVMLFYFYKSSR
jgi:hypothetical protein